MSRQRKEREKTDDKRIEEDRNNPGATLRDGWERSQVGGASEMSSRMGPWGILLLIVVLFILYFLFG